MITFLRFARAHTVIGTSLSLLTLYLIAARVTGTYDWWIFALSLFSCLCANVYITGLNQLTDVEIDRINKPYLPLASGAYSLRKRRQSAGQCANCKLRSPVV
ncbi:MAG: UbiA family prenyltransferase, partial [Bacteroidota bacterium]